MIQDKYLTAKQDQHCNAETTAIQQLNPGGPDRFFVATWVLRAIVCMFIVDKKAMIRNRYKRIPHPAPNTKWERDGTKNKNNTSERDLYDYLASKEYRFQNLFNWMVFYIDGRVYSILCC